MDYKEFRSEVKSGDAILVEGTSVVSRLIRASTGQSVSHIASTLWTSPKNLFMPEQREWKAFQFGRASDRLQNDMKGCRVYYGAAPKEVRKWIDENHDEYVENVFSTRNEGYGYFALPQILWAQWRKTNVKTKNLVCSTWLQEQWEANGKSGWSYGQTMDPGDYFDACEFIKPIDLREYYEKKRVTVHPDEMGP